MKKSLVGLVVIAVVALVGAVGAVSAVSAYAQDNGEDPIATPPPGAPFGRMHRGWNAIDGDGPLHDDIVAAFADALGITPEDLDERLASGETLSSIAVKEGLGLDDFGALFREAKQKAIEKAQADGVLTQEQAQRMLRFMNGEGRYPDGIIGSGGACPIWGDADDAGAGFGGLGMYGNRLGGGRYQRP